jgi:hypothetical protein
MARKEIVFSRAFCRRPYTPYNPPLETGVRLPRYWRLALARFSTDLSTESVDNLQRHQGRLRHGIFRMFVRL